jgi:hypothetical protein
MSTRSSKEYRYVFTTTWKQANTSHLSSRLTTRAASSWLSLSYLIFWCCQLPFCEYPKQTTALHYKYDMQMYCTFVLLLCHRADDPSTCLQDPWLQISSNAKQQLNKKNFSADPIRPLMLWVMYRERAIKQQEQNDQLRPCRVPYMHPIVLASGLFASQVVSPVWACPECDGHCARTAGPGSVGQGTTSNSCERPPPNMFILQFWTQLCREPEGISILTRQ